MKRTGQLWKALASWENLLEASRKAALGKKRKPAVAEFLLNQESELANLRQELLEGSYQPGPYRTFTIREPKSRMISAAPFRDRVVHHALTQVLEPVFERRFTADSYACRQGLGVHAALTKGREAARRYPFVLKCDIQKYFPSIDHEILKDLLGRVIKCGPTLALAHRIIDGSNRQEEIAVYYPGDDLFTPFSRRRGLPLGNQTSQFFANVYLNPLDHFVARELRAGAYIRYVDDFFLFGEDKETLAEARARIVSFLCTFRLSIHPGKSRIYRVADGVTMLGWRLYPHDLRLNRGNLVRARRRMAELGRGYAAGKMSMEDVKVRVMAWLGHARFGNTEGICRSVLDGLTLMSGQGGGTGASRRFLEQQHQEPARFEPQQEHADKS